MDTFISFRGRRYLNIAANLPLLALYYGKWDKLYKQALPKDVCVKIFQEIYFCKIFAAVR